MALTFWENSWRDFSCFWSSFWCSKNFKFEMPNFTCFRAEMAKKTNSSGQNSVYFLYTSRSIKSRPKLASEEGFGIHQTKKIKIAWWQKILIKLTCLTTWSNISGVSWFSRFLRLTKFASLCCSENWPNYGFSEFSTNFEWSPVICINVYISQI